MMNTRMLSLALAVVAVASLPAAAQELPPDVVLALECGTMFSMRSEEATASADEGAATEWFHRGDELVSRARIILETEGFSSEEIQNAMDSTALTVGFSIGMGSDPRTDEECMALSE